MRVSTSNSNRVWGREPLLFFLKFQLKAGHARYIKYKWATIAERDPGPEPAEPDPGCAPRLDARVLVERRVSEDGSAEGEKVWTYSYTASTTTVTDPYGNVEIHTFSEGYGQAPVEVQVEYRDSSGAPLRKVINNWVSDSGPLSLEQPLSYPPGVDLWVRQRNPRITRTTTYLLDSNQVSKTETDYADCYAYQILWQNFTDCRDNPTEVREYDYGSGSAGALIRKTTFTYLHNTNPVYRDAHLWDRVAEKRILDGAGVEKASTQFLYDTTPISATSGVPYHDYVGYPAGFTLRGNVAQVKRWNSSTGSWLTTTNYYNDVGNLVQTTDPGGHTTSFSYADNFTDGINRNSQGFLTQVTYPVANGVSHIERKQYFWFTGLPAAQCGRNFPSGSVCNNSYSPPQPDYAKFTYDSLGRPLTIVRGDGGQTTITFAEPALPSPANPIVVTSSTRIDASLNLVNSAVIDGLGRVKRTRLDSDPEGVVYTDTTYDALGRKLTVTNPYRSASDPTFGVTKFKYDALAASPASSRPMATKPQTPMWSRPSTSATERRSPTRPANSGAVTPMHSGV
jgi:hypothetical protein